uniref:Potassium channel subfamily K member 18 n=1 Tax=Parastrongyloides trichosuri TaxID=131310 RepID=A0A0N5A3W1_PARTI
MFLPIIFTWIKKNSHIFIHLSMMTGVTLYVLFGAFIMQSLENKNIVKMNEELRNKRDINKFVMNTKNVIVENKENIGINYYKKLNGHELAMLDQKLHPCIIKAMESLYNFSKCQEKHINVAAITNFDDCYKHANLKVQSLIKFVDRYGRPIDIETSNFNAKEMKEIKEQSASVFFKKKFRPGQLKGTKQNGNNSNTDLESQTVLMDWSFGSAIIFTFSVITTIGYGHVAPMTTSGRLFTIFYGLIGVPFTLLTIANVGLFLSHTFKLTAIKIIKWKKYNYNICINRVDLKKKIKQFEKVKTSMKCCLADNNEDNIKKDKLQSVVWCIDEKLNDIQSNYDATSLSSSDNSKEIDESEYAGTIQIIMTLLLAISTFFYILFGAYIVHLYEVDMDFFQAFYFNFITLTTIGLGDFVPQSYNYLAITIAYVFVGMALVTVTLNLLSDILRKLHNFGRKIENVGDVIVWFGGKKMKMANLMQYLVDTLNLPEETLQTMDVDNFIDNAIQKEVGKIESLRPKPFSLSDVADRYSRDIEAEAWFMDATERSSHPASAHINSGKPAKVILETINHKISPISTSNELKIKLETLNDDKTQSPSGTYTRKSSSGVFYRPSTETFSRSIDNTSFEDITLNEKEKSIF